MANASAQKVLAISARRSSPAPRRVRPADIDHIVEVSVNVPFKRRIKAETIAKSIQEDRVAPTDAGHVARFVGELSAELVLRFCRKHGIHSGQLRTFIGDHRRSLAIHNPGLEARLDDILSRPGRTA